MSFTFCQATTKANNKPQWMLDTVVKTEHIHSSESSPQRRAQHYHNMFQVWKMYPVYVWLQRGDVRVDIIYFYNLQVTVL